MEENILKGEDALKKNDEDQSKTSLSIEEQLKIVEEIKSRLESIKI